MKALPTVVLCIGIASPATAAILLLDHFTSYGPVVNTAPPGWTKTPEAGGLGPDCSTSSYIQTGFDANSPGSDGDSNFVSGHQLGSTLEGFQRNVTGFTIGEQYHLTFDYAGSTSSFSGLTSQAFWKVLLDDSIIDSSAPVSLQSSEPLSWSTHQLIFTATATMHNVGFNPSGSTGDTTAYFDNVMVQLVPEPSGVSLVLVFGIALAVGYRRRANRSFSATYPNTTDP